MWGGEMSKFGEGGQKYKIPVIKYISPSDEMYSMVTTVSDTILYI